MIAARNVLARGASLARASAPSTTQTCARQQVLAKALRQRHQRRAYSAATGESVVGSFHGVKDGNVSFFFFRGCRRGLALALSAFDNRAR
jgi:hypothetical protein